jgi:hypothetical protein
MRGLPAHLAAAARPPPAARARRPAAPAPARRGAPTQPPRRLPQPPCPPGAQRQAPRARFCCPPAGRTPPGAWPAPPRAAPPAAAARVGTEARCCRRTLAWSRQPRSRQRGAGQQGYRGAGEVVRAASRQRTHPPDLDGLRAALAHAGGEARAGAQPCARAEERGKGRSLLLLLLQQREARGRRGAQSACIACQAPALQPPCWRLPPGPCCWGPPARPPSPAHLLPLAALQRVQRAVHALVHVVQQRADMAVHLVLLLKVGVVKLAGVARQGLRRAAGRGGGRSGAGGGGKRRSGVRGCLLDGEGGCRRGAWHTLAPPTAPCSFCMPAVSLFLKAGTFL